MTISTKKICDNVYFKKNLYHCIFNTENNVPFSCAIFPKCFDFIN